MTGTPKRERRLAPRTTDVCRLCRSQRPWAGSRKVTVLQGAQAIIVSEQGRRVSAEGGLTVAITTG